MTKLREFFSDKGNDGGKPTMPEEPSSATNDTDTKEQRVLGKIIKVSDEGWGFISSKDIKFTRIFFHWSSLRQDTLNFAELKNGMKVEFTPVQVEDKGWRAIKIKVLVDGKDESKAVT